MTQRIGVLAAQGGFEAHASALSSLGAQPIEVRVPEQLEGLDGLVIPGGESTTITKALARDGLDEAIRGYARGGGALLGTCAGMIVLDRSHLGLLDIDAERNAFGRQRQSFEHDLAVEGLGPEPLRAVFIRAPWVAGHGPGVEVLAEYDGHPVVVREGRTLACSFHPELTDDTRLHALFMAIAGAEGGGDSNDAAARALPER
ncbi:MAG TPA: pyridoxal 5'-phosphate synthase glutaminase subunit PdxT [Solirubrobacterales bacterium]